MRLWGTLVFLFFTWVCAGAQRKNSYQANPLPDKWTYDDVMFQQTLPVDDNWWRVFEDATLDSLISVAIKQNPDVMMAMNRIDMAKSSMRMARGAFFPSLSLNAGWSRQKTSGYISDLQPEAYNGYYSGTADMQWQIDVFGSLRDKFRAQKENYIVSKEDYNATMVSLCAQVATAYFYYLEQQQLLQVLQRNAASQDVVVKITEVRYNTGLASKLDVAQAKSVYYSTLASIPATEAAVAQYRNTIAVLLGLYPEDLENSLTTLRPLPNYVEPVGVGMPAQLLLRRPDVRAAEHQVNAQAALLGVAKKEWFPTFFLNGTFGYSSHDLKNMGKRAGMVWSIAPSMSWTIFNGGQRLYNVKMQRAQLDETINQFNNTVLTAVQEVDNAMGNYKSSIRQISACQQMVNQGRDAFRLSLDLYKQGLSEFQNVLDAQRSLLSYENALVQAKGVSLIYLVQMYQSLGGGWNYNATVDKSRK